MSKDGAVNGGEGSNGNYHHHNYNKNGGGGAAGSEKDAQVQSRVASFQKLVSYCEGVGKCRHVTISEFFDEPDPPACDYACDFCKDPPGLRARKTEGLASEEWVSTQRERDDFYGAAGD